MARRVYTDEDKAAAFVVWKANSNNVKRTARETGVPISTVRRWTLEWEREGPPDTSLVEVAVGDFLSDAERVRHKALNALEEKIPDATPSALVATVGMLTDKIHVVKGIATSRQETVHKLPPAEEIAKTLSTAFSAAIEAARARDADIVEADIIDATEVKELAP
jgi:transposase-like protein